ncbi:hypothetical protein MBLNU459_g8278t2 [Dothideomycetes sp. NU459]
MKDVEWAFTSIRRLGASGSVVDQVRNRMSDLTYARKKLRRGEDPKSRKSRLREFRTELQALHKVHHEHLIACVGSYTDENVFELPNSEHVNVTTDKTSAVAYLHEQKIRHNDIKPTNILIHEGRVLICDFGISKDWEGREEGTTSGTIQGMTERYCAPEIKFARDRNETSDVFSLGCVFLEMLTVLSRASIDELNRFLTDSRTSRETTSGIVTFWSNINKIVAWLDQLALPDEFELVKSLVTQMVKENPRLRLKAFKVVEVLQKTSKFIGECCGGSASSTTRNPLPDIRVNNQALDSAATKHASSTTETGYDIANPASGTWTPPSTAEASPDLNTSSDKTSGGNKPVDSLNESPGTKSLEYQGTRSTDVQSMGSEPQQTSISLISKTLIPENNPEGDLDLVLEVDLIGFKVIRGCLTSGKSDGSPGDVGMQLKIYQTRKQMWEITRRLKITTFNPEAQRKGALTFRLQDDDNTHERWITGLLPRTGVIKNSRSKEAEIVLGAVSKSDKLDRGDIKCKTKHKVHDSKFRILFSTEHDLHSFSNAIHDYESHASFALVPTTTISVSSERRNSLRTMNS